MKKKFLILTLCFTLIFSSLNYKKTYAYSGLMSLPILATVSSLAVGACILVQNNDDLYDLGRMFYDYVDNHNDLTWETVSVAFASASSIVGNKVSVDSKFLDIVKDFFDYTFSNNKTIYIDGFPIYPNTRYFSYGNYSFGNLTIDYEYLSSTDQGYVEVKYFDKIILRDYTKDFNMGIYTDGKIFFRNTFPGVSYFTVNDDSFMKTIVGEHSFPYEGGYNWDNVESKKENNKVALPIPGNLGHLVGQGSSEFWGNTNDLVGNGDISIPSIDNPSIDIGGDTSFPGVVSPDVPGVDSPSVPNEGVWATIKEFIIGLVVPSDTYWTDTWGGLYDNFTNSFPMVDMDGFNDLVTGEKKFPNIDINIMGVNGRVVNGDIVNSIVDWLRPIIAGFMMLCLMFFNYRKLYKLIRNSEPFEGIGKVENHAN